jgi:hypothetical protein
MYQPHPNSFLPESHTHYDPGRASHSFSCRTKGGDGFCSGAPAGASIRIAATDDQRKAATDLINRMYAWRGYGSDHVIPSSPDHVTFNALFCCQAAGTITLAVDTHNRLAADTLFRDQLDHYRSRTNARICELTKLAFDVPDSSQALLAALFHSVFIYGYRRYRCTDLFIEVNPRHRRFYQAMLGFEAVGEIRHHEGVDAPAQLMHLPISAIRRSIDDLAHGGSSHSVRSLYPFFFRPQEEDDIYSRLDRTELRLGNERFTVADHVPSPSLGRGVPSRPSSLRKIGERPLSQENALRKKTC